MTTARASRTAIRKNGQKCGRTALVDGTDRCFWHSDRVSDAERRAAAQKGALVLRQRSAVPAVADVRMRSPESCPQLLEQTVEEMKTGKLDPRTGNAVSYAIGTAVKIWEVMLSNRISRLDKMIHG